MHKVLILGVVGLLLGGVAVAQQHQQHGAMQSFTTDSREAFTATPAFAADGSLWLARGGADRVTVSRSTDGGKTFGAPIRVTAEALNMDWGPDSRPQIAIEKDGSLLVTYAIFQDKRFNGRVFYARLASGATAFSEPRPITPDSTSQRFQAAAIDADGRVFAAWLDKRDAAASLAAGKPYPGAALAYAWSDDGKTFSDTHLAIDNTCECCRLGLAFAGPGRPVVIFRNVFEGSVRDHALVTFKDRATPGPLRRLSVDNWKIDACPHQGPSIAIAPDGSYHATWSTSGTERQGLFYARADNGDAPFEAPRPLSSTNLQPARPYLLAAGASLHLAWKEFDGERTRVQWQHSEDSGRTWSPARAIAETEDASDHPILVTDGKRSYLSWLTKAEGYRLIALEAAR